MSQKHDTWLRVRGAVSLLLAVVLLVLSLSSCDFIDLGGSDHTPTTTVTPGTTGVPTTQRTPATTDYPGVTVGQYLSPEIPSDAGTYAYVAKQASSSVVSIITESIVYDRYNGSYVKSGAGSGVVCYVDNEAGRSYIITNNHVVEGSRTVVVCRNDSDEQYVAEILGTDWQTDIAVLAVDTTDFVAVQCGTSDSLQIGQLVAAIGNPLGTLGGTMTDGIVSSLARELTIEGIKMTLIQHSAPVSPGNSGGGLFNLYGQLIGIVNAKSTGTSIEGIGYAIPVNIALDRVEQILEKGYVSGTPYLGISYATSSYATTAGELVVSDYLYNDELEATNQDTLQENDILYSLDGVTVSDVSDVRRVLSSHEIGESVTAVFYRPNRYNYVKVTVNLTIHEYVPDAPSQGENSGDIEFK